MVWIKGKAAKTARDFVSLEGSSPRLPVKGSSFWGSETGCAPRLHRHPEVRMNCADRSDLPEHGSAWDRGERSLTWPFVIGREA